MTSQFLANRVIDNIYIGSRYASDDYEFLSQNQIKRVINLVGQAVQNKFQYQGIKYLTYKFERTSIMLDDKDENISQIVKFIQECFDDDTQVLIQSDNGDNRAVIITAAYLVHRFHWPCEKAVDFVSIKRPDIVPTQNLVDQLIKFSDRRKEKYGPFKNIFQLQVQPKMNCQELNYRNTFLNYILYNQLTLNNDITQQQSPIQVLIQNKVLEQKKFQVRFRDNLTTTQPSAKYATFNQNNQPLHPSLSSTLFRGRTVSYKDNQITHHILKIVDSTLVPYMGVDYDTKNLKKLKTDTNSDLNDSDKIGPPVSILKTLFVNTRESYCNDTYYTTVEQFNNLIQEQIQQTKKPEVDNLETLINNIGNIQQQQQSKPKERPQSLYTKARLASRDKMRILQQQNQEKSQSFKDGQVSQLTLHETTRPDSTHVRLFETQQQIKPSSARQNRGNFYNTQRTTAIPSILNPQHTTYNEKKKIQSARPSSPDSLAQPVAKMLPSVEQKQKMFSGRLIKTDSSRQNGYKK